MVISIIVAMDEKGLIGANGHLPWKLPVDMAHFRELTMGKPVVMGHKTFESIGGYLIGRVNLVLSKDPLLKLEGCVVVSSADEAIRLAGNTKELMVIGGASVYGQFLGKSSTLYLTIVHHIFIGDVYFSGFNSEDWIETGRVEHPADERNPYPCTFLTLQRRADLGG